MKNTNDLVIETHGLSTALPLLPYAGALGMLFLGLLFWLALTVMLSAFSNSRGMAIGVSLLLILGFELFVMAAPWTADYMPWSLTTAVIASRPVLAVSLCLANRYRR